MGQTLLIVVLRVLWGLDVYHTAVDFINSRAGHISSGSTLSNHEKMQD